MLLHTSGQSAVGVVPLAMLPAPDDWPRRSLHYADGEPLLVSCADNGAISVWDTATQIMVDDYQHRHQVRAVAWGRVLL